MKWEDTSSWSKSDIDRTPKVWTANLGKVKLIVHKHRDFAPNQWLATCHGLFEQVELRGETIEEAKCHAVTLLQSFCEDVMRKLRSR